MPTGLQTEPGHKPAPTAAAAATATAAADGADTSADDGDEGLQQQQQPQFAAELIGPKQQCQPADLFNATVQQYLMMQDRQLQVEHKLPTLLHMFDDLQPEQQAAKLAAVRVALQRLQQRCASATTTPEQQHLQRWVGLMRDLLNLLQQQQQAAAAGEVRTGAEAVALQEQAEEQEELRLEEAYAAAPGDGMAVAGELWRHSCSGAYASNRSPLPWEVCSRAVREYQHYRRISHPVTLSPCHSKLQSAQHIKSLHACQLLPLVHACRLRGQTGRPICT